LTGARQSPSKKAVSRLSTLAVSAAVALSPFTALAEESDNESWDGGFDIKAERRSDFVLGAQLGLTMGAASGYPNEIAKLDEPEFEGKTGFAFGPAGSAWIGGALRDWFTVGVGGSYLSARGPSGIGSGGAFILRVEAFPLYWAGGALRDLAVYTLFGAGGYTVRGDDGNRGEGGFVSFASLGTAYELLRLGPVALAPAVEYQLFRSQSAIAHHAVVGLRAVLYAGP
jgi:hypothetical protein